MISSFLNKISKSYKKLELSTSVTDMRTNFLKSHRNWEKQMRNGLRFLTPLSFYEAMV